MWYQDSSVLHGYIAIASYTSWAVPMWQTQVENEHYSTVSGPANSISYISRMLVEITPDFLCPFMNDWTTCTVNFRATASGSL